MITTGSFNKHPWLGASDVDMTYEISDHGRKRNLRLADSPGNKRWTCQCCRSSGRNGTGHSCRRTVLIGGDIIIALSGTRIKGIDDLATFLEEHTSPGQSINVAIIRNGETPTLPLTLESRP